MLLLVNEEELSTDPLSLRYTLTEGDFHHLKKARLTHLHIQPPALKILTIMECDSPENSVTVTEQPSQHPSLSIFQVTQLSLKNISSVYALICPKVSSSYCICSA